MPNAASHGVRVRASAAWSRVHTAAVPLPAARYDAAVRATRARALAEGLMAFMLGFSVDDLHVLRYPGWALGVAVAVLLIACGPLLHGVARARDLRQLDDAAFERAILSTTRRGRILLVAVAVVATAWLIIFSEGVPPWAV